MEKIALKPEIYAELLEAERGLTSMLSELDKADRCGVDCQNYRMIYERQMKAIQEMKQSFAPQV